MANSLLASVLSALAVSAQGLSGVEMECVTSFNWNSNNPNGYVFAPVANPEDPNSICAGGYESSGTLLTMYGNKQPRMFFKKADGSVLTIDLTKDTVSWWMDVSTLGAGYNGALYTAWTPSGASARSAASRYCDGNDGAGNGLWCPEFDLAEANRCGFLTTSHMCVSNSTWPIYCNMQAASPFPGYCGKYCNRGGLGEGPPKSSADFGVAPGDTGIDTQQAFHVAIKFTSVGTETVGFTTTLSQKNRSWSKSQHTAYKQYPGGYPSTSRMGLLAQLWNNSDASAQNWLSGANCSQTSNSDVSKVEVKMWDIKINDEIVKFKTVPRHATLLTEVV